MTDTTPKTARPVVSRYRRLPEVSPFDMDPQARVGIKTADAHVIELIGLDENDQLVRCALGRRDLAIARVMGVANWPVHIWLVDEIDEYGETIDS